MRIPPLKLANPAYELYFEGTMTVRSPDLKSSECEITWTEAYSMAVAGEIEGMATTAGRLKYFRRLDESERPEKPETAPQATSKSRGHLGAALHCYYEEVVSDGVVVGTLAKVRSSPRGKSSDGVQRWQASERIVRWTDRDAFDPNRFNPDRVVSLKQSVPLTPPMAIATRV